MARVTAENFDEVVLKSELPVLVDFYSDSCVACKRLAPTLGDIEDDYEGKLLVVKVNTSFDIDLSTRFGIMSNPTLMLFVKGESVGKKVGVATYEDIEDWISEYI